VAQTSHPMSGKKKLPPKVHEKGGRYYYVHQNKWRALSRVEEGARELHRQLAILEDLPPTTLAGIFAAFAAEGMRELKPPTQKQYDYFLNGILDHTFGHLMPSEVQPTHIAQYLEKRKKEGAAVSGNRERACLSSVFEFAMRRGWANSNPCRGVRRNKEKPSKVMIESKDLSSSMDRAPDHFAHVLQFAYMTGARQIDIVNMLVSAITDAGIEYTESKTGKQVSIGWTPTLRKLVRDILKAREKITSRPYANPYKQREVPQHDRLLTNRYGQPLSAWGITSNMRRLNVGWSFRAIRPKAQTDGGDRNVIGHTGQMRERYTRRRKLVPVR
jgi:site-specific recombinase XerD